MWVRVEGREGWVLVGRCHRIVVASSDNAPRLHPRIRVEKGVGG